MAAIEVSKFSLLALVVIIVMPRKGGASSTLRPLRFVTDASEYWIARFHGR
jgi:hypothetical protein